MSTGFATEREIDKEYLASLEKKLASLKDPKRGTSKQFLSDIASQKDHQLFRLITGVEDSPSGFADNFIDQDITIQPNYLQRKIAPQTCAINQLEKLHLVKSDLLNLNKDASTEGDSKEAQTEEKEKKRGKEKWE